MLDLDDGYSEEAVERHLSEMRKIINLKTPDNEFNDKYRNYLKSNSEVGEKNRELQILLLNE